MPMMTMLDALNRTAHRRRVLVGRLKSWPFEGMLTDEWHEALDELAELNRDIERLNEGMEG